MKTDFSIQRINLLLRKDWIENKKKLAYGVLVILGVLFFFLLSSILWDTRFRTFTLYVLGSLGTFIAFCSYVNLMIHRPRGLFLTLPASNQEKFAAILIEGIVVFLTYQVTFWTGTGIASMLIHIQPVAFKDIIMTLQDFTMLAFVGSLMFLSYVTFKKYALGIACGGYILIIASIIGIVYLCINILNIQPGMNSFCYESSPLYTAVYWLSFAFTHAFLIATLVYYFSIQSLFILIAERICDRVLSGNYKADSRIPSVRELAVEMEVNPNTVMRSFERLQANDIIYNKRGIGYFVASDAEQKIREMRHNQFVEEVLPAVFKEMHLLDVGIDELTKAYTLYISTIK